MTTNINDIMRMLPHRYPFLLIDRVLEISEDLTTLQGSEKRYRQRTAVHGTLPGIPGDAGVLIIEAMAQACAVLAMSRLTEEQKKEKALFYFAGIDEARFKRVVIPGDQLIFECKYIKDRAGIGWYEAVATVDGHVAATAKMMCARRPVE